MGFSTNTYVYGGGAQTFPVSFTLGYLSRDDVQVRINDEVDGNDDPVYAEFDWIDASTIEVIPSLTNGDSVEITRTVSKTELEVDFGAGADITPRNLSAQQLQIIMIVHELMDNRIEGELKSLSDLLIGSALEDIGLSQDAREGAEAAQAAAEAATISAVDAMTVAQTFALAEATDEEIISGEVERFVSPAGLLTAKQPQIVSGAGGEAVINLNSSINFHVTLSQNTNIPNPTTAYAGSSGVIVVEQGGAGGHSLTWGGIWLFSGGAAPDITGDTTYSLFRYFVLNSGAILMEHVPNL